MQDKRYIDFHAEERAFPPNKRNTTRVKVIYLMKLLSCWMPFVWSLKNINFLFHQDVGDVVNNNNSVIFSDANICVSRIFYWCKIIVWYAKSNTVIDYICLNGIGIVIQSWFRRMAWYEMSDNTSH